MYVERGQTTPMTRKISSQFSQVSYSVSSILKSDLYTDTLQIEFLALNGLQSIILPYNILLYRNQRSADLLPLIYNDIMIRGAGIA